MRVLVSGSTGMIGEALVARLAERGDTPVRLRRSAGSDVHPSVQWDPQSGEIDRGGLEGIDAVVHLAGEPIASSRWTDAQKARIRDSRVDGTRTLATALAGLDNPPDVLVSGSAIGFYGNRGDETLTEQSDPGSGFLTDVVEAWEAAAQPAVDAGVRVAYARTGIVLSDQGGALAEQLLLFKLGLGGKAGDGRQWMSWITLADEVAALCHLIDEQVAGPVNLTAPEPARNADFAKTLGAVLNRPTVLPVPKPIVALKLGRELTETLLFEGQKVLPEVLTESGFEFSHATLEQALRAVLGRD